MTKNISATHIILNTDRVILFVLCLVGRLPSAESGKKECKASFLKNISCYLPIGAC